MFTMIQRNNMIKKEHRKEQALCKLDYIEIITEIVRFTLKLAYQKNRAPNKVLSFFIILMGGVG